nr:M56 family metallopeptidase [Streptomyces scabichelini]
MVRARWPHRLPAIAVLTWQGLSLTFVMATALALYHLALADHHVHDGLIGLLSACGLAPHMSPGEATSGGLTPADTAVLPASVAVVLLPMGWLVCTAWSARRQRRRHADMLTMIGVQAPEYGATVVEYAVPAVYCLPGRRCRIVVTRGALEALTDAQVRAVVEHEKAHIRGRHHLLHVATRAFARAFPGLPLARHAAEQTALLLEMIADDKALRFHSRDALATALCEVAAGRAPQPALGAGGPGTLIRLHRILTPEAKPHAATRLGLAVASVTTPFLPLLLTCCLL